MRLQLTKEKIDLVLEYATKEIAKQLPMTILGDVTFSPWYIDFSSGVVYRDGIIPDNICCFNFVLPYSYVIPNAGYSKKYICELTEEFFNLLNCLKSLGK